MYGYYLSIVFFFFFLKDDIAKYLQPHSHSFIEHTFVKQILGMEIDKTVKKILQILGMEIYKTVKKKKPTKITSP